MRALAAVLSVTKNSDGSWSYDRTDKSNDGSVDTITGQRDPDGRIRCRPFAISAD
jgi:hypothetical protein